MEIFRFDGTGIGGEREEKGGKPMQMQKEGDKGGDKRVSRMLWCNGSIKSLLGRNTEIMYLALIRSDVWWNCMYKWVRREKVLNVMRARKELSSR